MPWYWPWSKKPERPYEDTPLGDLYRLRGELNADRANLRTERKEVSEAIAYAEAKETLDKKFGKSTEGD